MKKVNKKTIIYIGISLIIISGIFFYFRPLKFSQLINKEEELLITYNELKIDNGEPLQNTKNYDNLIEKKSEILDLLKKYPYRKMMKTMISDGSLLGIGEKLIYIYTYDDKGITNAITIAGMNNISINGKVYRMNNSNELITELLSIINRWENESR